MLFKPTFKLDIVSDKTYGSDMKQLEKNLEKYAHNGYFESFDQNKMFYEYYLTENSRASVVIVHGYTEFTRKYRELCSYFMNMGYSVFVYDLRCHGYSYRAVEDTQVTHVDYFEDYSRDLDCFMKKIVEPASGNSPIYIYSHSMGGAISTMYLENFENKVTKAVFSSPMIYPVCTPLPSFVLRRLLANEAKKYGWKAKFRFSHDFNPNPKAESRMDVSRERFQYNLDLRINDVKYQNSSGTNRWNYEVLDLKRKLLCKKLLSKVRAKTKTLVITAGKDTVVKIRPQYRLAKLLGCEHIVFENSKHSIHTTCGKELEKYVSALLTFFED